VQTALAEWCTRGDLVYHGLSGHHLLKGLPAILRVRLIAPLERRVQALLESHPQMTATQAADFIRDVDQDRARWVKVMYGADVNDPALYDIIISLETHTIESACEVVVAAAGTSRFQITDEVEEEFFACAAACRDRLTRAKGG